MIAVGSDHGGYELKRAIAIHLKQVGVEALDCGCFSTDAVDYPDIVEKTCQQVQNGTCTDAILVCGTGIGVSMAANKMTGIRAALCHSVYDAKMSKQHNNANVLCLGARTTSLYDALCMVEAYRSAKFEGGRHKRRVEKIMALEGNGQKVCGEENNG